MLELIIVTMSLLLSLLIERRQTRHYFTEQLCNMSHSSCPKHEKLSSEDHKSNACLHNAECKLVTVLFIRQETIDQEYNALNHGHYATIIA